MSKFVLPKVRNVHHEIQTWDLSPFPGLGLALFPGPSPLAPPSWGGGGLGMRLGWGLMACFGLPGATAQNCIQTAFFIVLQSNMKRAEKNELYRKRSPLFRLAGLRHKQVAWCSKRGAVWSSPCRKSDKSFSHHPRTSSQMSNIKKSCLSVKCSSLAWRH